MRTVIGFLLLIALLLGGLYSTCQIQKIQDPIAWKLEQAAGDVAADDWAAATVHCSQATRDWTESRPFTAIYADHNPMEDVDSLFARLEVACMERDRLEAAATCRELSLRLRAISEAHSPKLWNFL